MSAVGQSLPPAPVKPLDSDCCGQGCEPCILDIYQQELSLWEEECACIKRGEETEIPGERNEAPRLSPTKYEKYQIKSIAQEAKDVLRFTFHLPKKQSLGLSVGQHVIIRFYEEQGSTITRQYTPTSSISAQGFFEIMIKIYPQGRASQIIKGWKVGDWVEMRGPAGQMAYKRNKYDLILMLAAGTGVAPMCQVTQAILADEEEDTRLRLVYASRDYSCLMARGEIREWCHYWNFSCLFLLSQEPDNSSWHYKHKEEVERGRISKEIIQRELGSQSLNKVLVLVCGPRGFDADILAILSELGVPDRNIHHF